MKGVEGFGRRAECAWESAFDVGHGGIVEKLLHTLVVECLVEVAPQAGQPLDPTVELGYLG